jgi:type IV pilus assembly protein PilA
MRRLRLTSDGFTLIELMMVVAILGILAAIAIPNFVKFSCRSRTTEAKIMLKHVAVAQEAYRSEFDFYVQSTGTTLPDALDAKMQNTVDPLYDYFVPSATPTAYVAVGRGKVGTNQDGDRWEMTHVLTLSNPAVTPDCR